MEEKIRLAVFGQKRLSREGGIHCYQKKRKWYWSVQPEEGAMNESQV